MTTTDHLEDRVRYHIREACDGNANEAVVHLIQLITEEV